MSGRQKNADQPTTDAAELRQQAEAQVRAIKFPFQAVQNLEKIQQMLHELRVHQIELEMQNEELRNAQVAIEAERARYFDFYDLAPMGYLTLSEQGLILEANLTAAKLLGMARSTLLKQPLTRLIFKEDPDIYYRLQKQLLATGEAQECELRLVKPDGAFFWTHLAATAVQAEDGAHLYRLVIIDINERIRHENELRIAQELSERMIEDGPVAITMVNRDGKIVFANHHAEQLLGLKKTTIKTLSYNDPKWLISAVDGSVFTDEHLPFCQVMATGKAVYDIQHAITPPDSPRKILSINAAPLHDEQGRIDRVVFTIQDITEQRQAEEHLQKFKQIVSSTSDGIALLDINYRYVITNKAYETFSGKKQEEFIGLSIAEYLGESVFLEEIKPQFDRCLKGETISFQDWFEYPTLGRRFVEVTYFPYLDVKGDIAGVVSNTCDITERKQAEQQIAELNRDFVAFLENTTDFIYFKDKASRFRFCSQTLANITGHAHWCDMVGKHDLEVFPAETAQIYCEEESLIFREGRPLLNKIDPYFDASGNKRWVSTSKWPLLDQDGAVAGLFGISHDVTERYLAESALKEHQAQLEYIAHYDALTGLPNRLLLGDRLRHAMSQAPRRGQRLAVAYLDLDGFKPVNDTHGHDVGDQLLATLATRMTQVLRHGDTLGRLCGDEFVAVLVDLTDIEASVPILGRLLEAAAQPFQVGDIVLNISASLGVTFYPQDEAVDADQLLRQADQAMYQAKQAGKNRYHAFDAEQDRNVRGHHESLEHIRQALAKREFVLFYQPKVNMRTGEVIGTEALIRWQHPQSGLLLPAAFLPAIENHPLAIDLGEWVIDTALTQIETWRANGLSIPVSVNVGALQLQHPDFISRLRTLMSQHPGVNPGELELEILETSALEDFSGVIQVMASCQALGVGFALDDFGTGYSSLTYLKQLPAGLLKVDQSFVSDMLDDPSDLAILEGVLGLATAFRRQVIAEGVETLAHGEMLLRMGCEWAQGYAIARPMPANEFQDWFSTWDAPPSWKKLKQISRDRLPTLFAAVEHRAWIFAMTNFLSGKCDTPPEQDAHQCRFGHWLDHGGRALLLSEETDHLVDTLHREIHHLAAELMALKGDGRFDEVQTRISELHRLRDQLLEQLSELY